MRVPSPTNGPVRNDSAQNGSGLNCFVVKFGTDDEELREAA
jgi:hypothetical protein